MENVQKNRGIMNFLRKLSGQAVIILGLILGFAFNTETVFAADPANAPTPGSVVAGYLNDPDFQSVSANSVYQAPEGEIKATYTSVEHMRTTAANLQDGDYIQTLNYYEGISGGGAVYQVEEYNYTTDNGGTIIDLPGDIRCKLVSGNNTISPLQFGAYGDGENDDHAALEAAFNSGFGTIILEGRTYISNDALWITTSDITIEGMGATLTCNDGFGSYQAEGKESHVQVYLYKCSNIAISHLRIRDGQTTDHDRGLLYMQSVSNLDITWCTLEIPEWNLTDTNTKRCASTVSFQNGWHDVSVTHCEITNMAGVYEGGGIGFNDMYASGSDNALLEDNVIRYNVKDEVIAIFSHSREGSDYFKRDSYIRNILIRHNEFYGPRSTGFRRDLGFSVGYYDSLEVDNVVYEENYFETDAVWAFMTFADNATNCAARGNVINIRQTSENASSSPTLLVFKSSSSQQTVIENNIITVSSEYGNAAYSIAMGNVLFKNNQVTTNCNIRTLFEYYGAVSEGNKIQVNGDLTKAVSYQGGNMTDTDITITGNCGAMYESYTMVMKNDIIWKGNNIQIPNATSTGAVLRFNGMTMNGYTFTLEDNIISKPSATENTMLIGGSLQDTDRASQLIILRGNQFDAYYCKGNTVSIYRVNNVLKSYDNTIIRDYEVTFDLDGKGEAASQSVVEGGTAKEPEIKNLNGYEFLGWYEEKTYENLWDFEANTISQNTIIYGKLEKLPEEDKNTNTDTDTDTSSQPEKDLPNLSHEQTDDNTTTNNVTQNQTEKKPAKVTGVTLKRLKATSSTTKKRKVKITWKSVKGATGYQIYVSTNKGKKYKKVKTISAKKKRTYTYTSKKGKTVYVKIRAYKKKNGKVTYGSFSKPKKIKLK